MANRRSFGVNNQAITDVTYIWSNVRKLHIFHFLPEIYSGVYLNCSNLFLPVSNFYLRKLGTSDHHEVRHRSETI